ncbi:hypothetical protein BDD12DRAFT_800572 [Trichophaea hybrida]|nr:hypothetical protein BDD12DRAFT_800572 [Trichophaea hybrida]
MDPNTFRAIYIDRRAKRDREERRSDATPNETNRIHGTNGEHWGVRQNIQILLSTFSSVTICTSAQSCVNVLSNIDSNDLNPILLLLDIPLLPHPEEENSSPEGRHDSGIAASPADIFGLQLLKFVCAEIENTRMSNLIVPVVLLTGDDGLGKRDIDIEDPNVAREMQCVDNGAWDVVQCPLSDENAKTLHLHCYRAKRTVYKSRKRSWVGIDEPKSDNYSYLREKIPKRIKVSSSGRAKVIRQAVGQWDFSAHDFSDEELVYCAQTMFEHAFTMPGVSDFVIPSDRLIDFLIACRGSYNDQVPYHNFRHVVDVLQAIFFFMLQLEVLPRYGSSGALDNSPKHPHSLSRIITPMDALTLLVVAIGHDVGHPGPLAQLYNDKSVLESFHCAAFSQVLQNYWPKTLEVRKMMIDMILATDMGLHFDFMGKLDKLRKKYEKEGGSGQWDEKVVSDHRILLCALLIKCADISNVARKHKCSAAWATILIDEFARQANMEHDLGIPSSLVAPPVTGSVVALAKSQVGFMNLFAIPLFENLSKVLPEMTFSVEELMANKDSWSKKIEADEGSNQPRAVPSSTIAPSDQRSAGGNAVLGTALMDSDMPRSNANTSLSGSDIRSGLTSPRSPDGRSGVAVPQHTHSANGNATAVTVVVTHPKQKSARTNGYGPVSEKRPTYQHSTEHLRAGATSEASKSPDRPRSSPPDLGDCSDHSCSKGCCNTTAVVTSGAMQRRSSRFFKKVKLWKSWRKEPSDG